MSQSEETTKSKMNNDKAEPKPAGDPSDAAPSTKGQWSKLLIGAFIGAFCSMIVAVFSDAAGSALQKGYAWLRGDYRVKELEAQIDNAMSAYSTYVPAPQMSLRRCFTFIQETANELEWKVTSFNDGKFYMSVLRDENPIFLRCMGTDWGDTAIVSITSSEEAEDILQLTWQDINSRLYPKSVGTALLEPKDLSWTNHGPYVMQLSFKVSMEYQVFEKWMNDNVMPSAIGDVFSKDGVEVACNPNASSGVCNYQYPRHTVSIISPWDPVEIQLGNPMMSRDFYYAIENCAVAAPDSSSVELLDSTISNVTEEIIGDSGSGSIVQPAPIVVEEVSVDGVCGGQSWSPTDTVVVPVQLILSYMAYGETGPYGKHGIDFGAEVKDDIMRITGVDKQFGVQWNFWNWK